MKRWIALAAYAASVFLSFKFCAEYWVTGPVFAAALLLVNYEQVLKGFSFKYVLLSAASTLIYALVVWISSNGWRFHNNIADMLMGSTSCGVVAGSFLMPGVHAVLFGIDIRRVRTTILLLLLSWYGALLASWIDDKSGLRSPVNYALVAIALWQGFYLYRLKLGGKS